MRTRYRGILCVSFVCNLLLAAEKQPEFPLNYRVFDSVSDDYNDQDGAQRLPAATLKAAALALKDSPPEHLAKNVLANLTFKKMMVEPNRSRGSVVRLAGQVETVIKVKIAVPDIGIDSVWFGQIVLSDQSVASFISLEEPAQKPGTPVSLTGIFVQRFAYPNKSPGEFLSWTPLIVIKSLESSAETKKIETAPETRFNLPREGNSILLATPELLQLKMVKIAQEWKVECDGLRYSLGAPAHSRAFLEMLTRRSKELAEEKSSPRVKLSIPQDTPMQTVAQVVEGAAAVNLTNITYVELPPAVTDNGKSCHYRILSNKQGVLQVHILERGKPHDDSVTVETLREKLKDAIAKVEASRVLVSYDSSACDGDLKALFHLCAELKIRECGAIPLTPER